MEKLRRRAYAAALAVFAVSAAVRLTLTLTTGHGLSLIDLRVYVAGAAAARNGSLYYFTYVVEPGFELPFTYPPFAGLTFAPLADLPFATLAVVWQVATIAAIYVMVRICLEFLVGEKARTRNWQAIAAVWSAAFIWAEPIRSTLDFGQVNMFFAAATVIAIRDSRWWVTGGLVGLTAGIKLTPAITGFYLLGQRRVAAAAAAAAAFAGSVVISFVVIPAQSQQFFEFVLGDADRIGSVMSGGNLSVRGALSRIVGHDVGTGTLWLTGVVLAIGLAGLAWRSLETTDILGRLIVVELLGMLVSPISWSHHWVWTAPLLLWLVHGAGRARCGRWVALLYWIPLVAFGTSWTQAMLNLAGVPVTPGLVAFLGSLNVGGVFGLFAWIAATRPKAHDAASPSPAVVEHVRR